MVSSTQSRGNFKLPKEELQNMSPDEREAFNGTLALSSCDFYGLYKQESQDLVSTMIFQCCWYAAYGGQLAIVKKFSGYSLSSDGTRTYRGDTAFHAAARKAHLTVIVYFLERRVDVNSRNVRGQTALHVLLEEEDEIPQTARQDVARLLLEKGTFPDIPDDEGVTSRALLQRKGWEIPIELSPEQAFFQSIETGDFEEFSTRLQQLQNQNELYDSIGCTPFHSLLFSPIPFVTKERMIQKLVKVFPRMIDAVERRTLDDGRSVEGPTALHKAVEKGEEKFAKALLDAGANPKCLTKTNDSPLHSAPTLVLVELLCQKGAELDQATKYGATPLHRAAERGRTKVLKALLKKGANPKLRDEWGETPLHRAVTAECARELLRKAPDLINDQNNEGATPLHIAINRLSSGFINGTSLIEELLKAKPNLSLKTKRDKLTPLAYAKEKLSHAKKSQGRDPEPLFALERAVQLLTSSTIVVLI